jgi:CheY-like chemotaxis protein
VSAAEDPRPIILVIDDEPTIRKTVGRLLERAGYRVRTAGTGAEALELVRTEHFDAAICDLDIAGTSGVALCERIWESAPDLAGHLVIASGDLSGEGVDELVERAGGPPVAKPFTAADLLHAVGTICPAPPLLQTPEIQKAAS